MKNFLISILRASALPLLGCAVVFFGILVWWGLFASVAPEIKETGYYYAYLDAEGPYYKLTTKRGEVDGLLREQGIEPGSSIAIIYDDPRTTPKDKLRARTGFVIDANATPKEPLKVDTLPPRRVVSVSVKAHPFLAYGKTYGALLEYAKAHDMPLRLPTVELYDFSVLTVEMPLEEAAP
ncbi:MAG: GyrI-like domain-containing protein [Methylobacillus sp.]|nr:GyrI-like domain-containing protein [Methylobacillus sp.]